MANIWTTPKDWIDAILTALDLNQQLSGNARVLKTQIADDGKIVVGQYNNFRGMQVRTHPDQDLAASWIAFQGAEELLLSDGFRLRNVGPLAANLAASGVNGLDAGAEAASTWYDAHVIRKSSDGTLGMLLHKSRSWSKLTAQLTLDTTVALRNQAANTRIAQSFQVNPGGVVDWVDVVLARVASPVGRVWFTIEADNAGSPSGVPLCTSDKLDAALLSTSAYFIRVPFSRSPATLAAATTYWLVGYGDFTINVSNYVTWSAITANVYANGAHKRWDGVATWSTSAVNDLAFRVGVLVETALTLPSGYDQSCLVGFFYNDSGSNFNPTLYMNRRMIPLALLTIFSGSGSLTAPTLVDTSALIPPVPHLFYAALFNNTASVDTTIRGVPDGYRADALNMRGGGMVQTNFGSAANYVFEVAPVFSMYQSLYVMASISSTFSLNTGTVEW